MKGQLLNPTWVVELRMRRGAGDTNGGGQGKGEVNFIGNDEGFATPQVVTHPHDV